MVGVGKSCENTRSLALAPVAHRETKGSISSLIFQKIKQFIVEPQCRCIANGTFQRSSPRVSKRLEAWVGELSKACDGLAKALCREQPNTEYVGKRKGFKESSTSFNFEAPTCDPSETSFCLPIASSLKLRDKMRNHSFT